MPASRWAWPRRAAGADLASLPGVLRFHACLPPSAFAVPWPADLPPKFAASRTLLSLPVRRMWTTAHAGGRSAPCHTTFLSWPPAPCRRMIPESAPSCLGGCSISCARRRLSSCPCLRDEAALGGPASGARPTRITARIGPGWHLAHRRQAGRNRAQRGEGHRAAANPDPRFAQPQALQSISKAAQARAAYEPLCQTARPCAKVFTGFTGVSGVRGGTR